VPPALAGGLPEAGGVRPQLLVTVDLDSLLGRAGSLGGEAGWAGPLDPAACRRLAWDGTVTRVLVTRHPSGHPDPDHGAAADLTPGDGPAADHEPSRDVGPTADHDPSETGLPERLQTAMTLLPQPWAAPPPSP
jgi:hypothetical protein